MIKSRWASDDEFRAQVREARLMTVEDKLLAGPRMFDEQCRVISDALRAFTPYAEDSDVRAMLKDLVAWRKSIEDRPCPNFVR